MYLLKILCIFLFPIVISSQTIDEFISKKKMEKDLEIFQNIRVQANSGLYKYRSKKQIDSLYNWAFAQLDTIHTFRNFYKLINTLTDFEGSCHNSTDFSKYNLYEENFGYFPHPIKWIEGKWILNKDSTKIPLGAEILTINGKSIEEIVPKLYKYYTTDGFNITGKIFELARSFPLYYRYEFGKQTEFKIQFKEHNSTAIQSTELKSVSLAEYSKNFRNRHSRAFDRNAFIHIEDNKKYSYRKIDSTTGILTIKSFSLGNKKSESHKKYAAFLDSIFMEIKKESLKNLIVDIRNNDGGDDPNDLLTYSYLAQRNFQENTEAFISFKKIPFIKYYDINIPRFIRPFVVGKYNREIQNTFPIEKNWFYYESDENEDHEKWKPNKNAFTGNIYLLINPEVASAASLFGAMLAGNPNTITIGEESLGGYFGHNGHTNFSYKLPKSKILISFDIVNLTQDVLKRANQLENRGIMPDYEIHQEYDDFINNKDTQLQFTLNLIRTKQL